MIYCNYTNFQTILKKQWRKIRNNETNQELIQRHSFIAIWARFIWESVWIYGKVMKENDKFFCGLNNKLLFKIIKMKSITLMLLVGSLSALHKDYVPTEPLATITTTCTMRVHIDGEDMGDIVFGMYGGITPKSNANFAAMCN